MQFLRSSMVRLGRIFFVLCAALALTGLLAACGGGGAAGGGVTAPAKGNVAVVLTFPQAPGSAHPHGTPQVGGQVNLFGTTQSVIVELLDPADKTHVIATEKANRNGQDKLTVTFDNVALGNYLVYVLCYDGVDQTGQVSAVALPPVTVVAGTTEVPISETQNAAVVTELMVTPNPATVNVGATQQMTATATLSDNSQVDVTQLSTWSLAQQSGQQVGAPPPAAVSVDPASGLVTGVVPGGIAEVQASFNGFKAQAAISVAFVAVLFDDTSGGITTVQYQTFVTNQTYNLTAYRIAMPDSFTPVANDPNTMTVTVGHGTGANFVAATDNSLGTVSFTNGHWVYTAPATAPNISPLIIKTTTPDVPTGVELHLTVTPP